MTHYTKDYDVNSMYGFQAPGIGVYTNYVRVGVWTPTEWPVYRVLEDIGQWIESQPEDMRVEVPEARQGFMQGYALSPELESWFLVRYS